MKGSTRWYDAEQLRRISEVTIAHYDRLAEAYWDGTRDHDVTQNYAALLDAIEGDHPYSILDLGCDDRCRATETEPPGETGRFVHPGADRRRRRMARRFDRNRQSRLAPAHRPGGRADEVPLHPAAVDGGDRRHPGWPQGRADRPLTLFLDPAAQPARAHRTAE